MKPFRSPVRDPARRPGSVARATIEYDGGRYRGWQAQVNARTVQGSLVASLHEIAGPDVVLHGAGRTDAGVHALGQVASLHLPPAAAPVDLEAFRRRWNDLLPADINVLSLVPAPPGFHARHDAVLRVYRYRFSRRRTAFGKPFVYWVKDALDAPAMDRAAAALAGLHDFASFCENPEGHDSTLVKVAFARVEEGPPGSGLVLFRIGASHFLWKMVRRVAGVLLEVGAGRLPEGEVARLLAQRTTGVARLTVPPSGLFLEAVLLRGGGAPPGRPAPPRLLRPSRPDPAR